MPSLIPAYKHKNQEKSMQHDIGLVQACIGRTHTLAWKRRKVAKHIPSLTSVKTSLHKPCRQVSYLPTSQKHDPSASKTPLYTKSLFCCKIGQALQTWSHNQIPSCVLSQDSSNTFQSTHLNYPRPPLQAVTPLTHFSIFVSKLCRLSSVARFKLF